MQGSDGHIELREQFPACLALKRSKNELVFFVPPQDKLDAPVAQIANAVKENDLFIGRNIHLRI
jgi:hypothetical protein